MKKDNRQFPKLGKESMYEISHQDRKAIYKYNRDFGGVPFPAFERIVELFTLRNFILIMFVAVIVGGVYYATKYNNIPKVKPSIREFSIQVKEKKN